MFCRGFRFGAGSGLWLLVSVVAIGPAHAQSFFEKLFGWGDPRPQPSQSAAQQRLGPTGGALPFERAPQLRPHEPRGHNEDAVSRGGTVQTMCVRTCDGYYWPVHFPVSRRDLRQDASLCEATCGAQTKLYTREGPGTEPEEMRDADGQSYGASATAFAYRRGLVNGCACHPMPWSDAERARHEGYGLAAAEMAIRVALAAAETANEARIASELAETKLRDEERDKALSLAAVGTASVAGSAFEPAVGPAEAAAVAAFAANQAPRVSTVEEHGLVRKQKHVDANDRVRTTKTKRLERGTRHAEAQTSRLSRGVTGQAAAPRNAVFAATGSKFWLAQ